MVANLGLGTSLEHVEVDPAVTQPQGQVGRAPDVGMGKHNVSHCESLKASAGDSWARRAPFRLVIVGRHQASSLG
eukprot:291751-Hanusia_phi.AAC.1